MLTKHLSKLITSLCVTALLCGTGVTASLGTSNHHVHASRPVISRYWKNRLKRATNQRRSDYYPDINWNARSLGGYKVGRNYVTRPDLVYRGANLHNLTARGARQLKRLHVNSGIDLRYPYGNSVSAHAKADSGEFHTRNPYHLHIHYHDEPLYTFQQKQATRHGADKYGEIYHYGWAWTINPQARKTYRRALLLIANHKHGATYINCTGGIDRTGLLSALLLSTAGVSKYQIYNDYLLSNVYYYKKSYPYLISELNHWYRTIDHHYGSVHNYLHRGLKLSNHQINKVRNRLIMKRTTYNRERAQRGFAY